MSWAFPSPRAPIRSSPGDVRRHAWGREVVARIDAVLAEERPGPAYRGIVEAWAAPEDLPGIRAVYDAFLASD